MSGGNKRKINILVGLLGKPRILILDEPTVGIDLKSRHDIHQLLNIMKSKCLIILTTHHLDEVEALADDIKLIGQDPFLSTCFRGQTMDLYLLLKRKNPKLRMISQLGIFCIIYFASMTLGLLHIDYRCHQTYVGSVREALLNYPYYLNMQFGHQL